MTRRILQAEGLDAAKDVSLLSMDTPARLQSLFSGRVAGAMMTPPSIYIAEEKGYKLFGRGRDYMRYLQTGVVSTDTHIKQRRDKLVRFLKACARRFSVRETVVAWNSWNENRWRNHAPDFVCFCKHTTGALHDFLRRRYGDLDHLGGAWGRRYRSWRDVRIGRLRGSGCFPE